MTAKKPSRKQMLPLCGEIHPEDGMDPREFARKGRPRKGDRKVRQLCSQVADTILTLAYFCAAGDFRDSGTSHTFSIASVSGWDDCTVMTAARGEVAALAVAE